MKRDILSKLLGWKESRKRKPLMLRGVRQTGKTYILQEFGKNYFRKTHYLNFEDDGELLPLFDQNLDPYRIIKDLEFYLDTKIEIEKDMLIFDEIQASPRALTSLKYFAEKMSELAVCSAGSLLGIHLSEGSFPVGKVDMMSMYPMSFHEFLVALDDHRALEYIENVTLKSELPEIVHQHLWERLKWYFIVGGLPEVVQTFCENRDSLYEAFRLTREKQKELIVAYLADIAKHSGKVNAMHIERVWRSIPNQLSKTQDGSAKKFHFKGVIPGIDRYNRLVGAIDWLEAANLIIKVKISHSGKLPFSAYSEENNFKLVHFDVGLLGAMSELSPKSILGYDYGSYKGYFAENFVAQEFLSAGLGPLYSWKENRSEVEFIMDIDAEAIPIEVKSGWVTRAGSLSKFVEKYQAPYSVVLSAKNLSRRNRTHYIPLYLASHFLDRDLQ